MENLRGEGFEIRIEPNHGLKPDRKELGRIAEKSGMMCRMASCLLR